MKNQNYIMSVKGEHDFTFCIMPKELDTNKKYTKMSILAKYLYTRLLDRAMLSAKNHFYDSKRRAYIFFTREEAAALLNCGYNTATKAFKELREADLIEEKSQGKKKANMIFVKLPEKSKVNKERREKFQLARKTLVQKRKEFLKKLNSNIKSKKVALQKMESKLQYYKQEIQKSKDYAINSNIIDEVKLQMNYTLLQQDSQRLHTAPALLNTLLYAIAEMKQAPFTKVSGSYYTQKQTNEILDTLNETTIIDFCADLKKTDLHNIKSLKAYLKSALVNFMQEEELQLFLFQQSLALKTS